MIDMKISAKVLLRDCRKIPRDNRRGSNDGRKHSCTPLRSFCARGSQIGEYCAFLFDGFAYECSLMILKPHRNHVLRRKLKSRKLELNVRRGMSAAAASDGNRPTSTGTDTTSRLSSLDEKQYDTSIRLHQTNKDLVDHRSDIKRLWKIGKESLRSRSMNTMSTQIPWSDVIRDLYKVAWACEDVDLIVPLLWIAVQYQGIAPTEFSEAILEICQNLLSLGSDVSTQDHELKLNNSSALPKIDALKPSAVAKHLPVPSLTAALEACVRLNLWNQNLIHALMDAIHSKSSSMDVDSAVRCLAACSKLRNEYELSIDFVEMLSNTIFSENFNSSVKPRKLGDVVLATLNLSYPRDVAALKSLGMACKANYRILKPVDISRMLWILAKREAADVAFLTDFAPTIHHMIPRYQMRELADIARAYGKYGLVFDDLFNAIAKRAIECIYSANPDDISRLVTVFHQLGLQPDAFLDVVEEWANRRLSSLSPRSLVMALANFARMEKRSQKLLGTAAACVTNKLEHMTCSQLSAVVWAFARLNYKPPEVVLKHAVDSLIQETPTLSDRDISNALWGLARLDYPVSSDELDNISGRIILRSKTAFSGHSAALILWSFGTMKYKAIGCRQIYSMLIECVIKDLKVLDPQSISLSAWALGTMEIKQEEFARAVNSHYHDHCEKLLSFEPHQLVNLVWGLAKSGIRPDLVHDLTAHVNTLLMQELNSAEPQVIFNLSWTNAKMNLCTPQFLFAVTDQLLERNQEFTDLELIGTLWTVSNMLTHAKYKESKSILSDAEEVDLRRICWELLIMADEQFPNRASSLPGLSEIGMALQALSQLEQFANADLEWDVGYHAFWTILPQIQRQNTAERQKASIVSISKALISFKKWIDLEKDIKHLQFLSRWGDLDALNLRPHELSIISFALTEINFIAVAGSLIRRASSGESFTKKDGSKYTAKMAPARAIELLAAMSRSDEFPESIFRSIKRALARMAPAYRLHESHLKLMAETFSSLPNYYAVQIKMNPIWRERINDFVLQD